MRREGESIGLTDAGAYAAAAVVELVAGVTVAAVSGAAATVVAEATCSADGDLGGGCG